MLTETLLKNPREVLAAAPDVARLALGLPVAHPHPLASSVTLADVALILGRAKRAQQPHETDAMVQGRGMASDDFGNLLADAARGVVERRYELAADHLGFAAPVQAADFRPFTLPGVDAAGLSLEPVTELGELVHGAITTPAGAAAAALQTFGRAVTVSRRAVVNGTLAALDVLAAGAAVNAARLEARLVAEMLERNPVQDDAAPLFRADFGNVLDGRPLTPGDLSAAMGALRKQPTSSGEPAGMAARHLVVGPDLEGLAYQAVQDAGLSERIAVHCLPSLPAWRWYLLADPSLQPCVGVLRLRGARVPVRVERARRELSTDGVPLRVVADAGAVALGRVGIVRAGVQPS